MMKLFKILFFLGAVFSLNADGLKSVTIKHIGETDGPKNVIIINTVKSGQLHNVHEGLMLYYITAEDILFSEMVNLTISCPELFSENCRRNEYSCLELHIEYAGEEYYLYLNDSKSSVTFLKKLFEMVKTRRGYDDLIAVIEILIGKIEEKQ